VVEQALRQPVAERAEQQAMRLAAPVLAPLARGVAAGYWRPPEALAPPVQP